MTVTIDTIKFEKKFKKWKLNDTWYFQENNYLPHAYYISKTPLNESYGH